ncbi:hypothetical protein DFH09DRAFT_1458693 [Mycena vulgaris]|nr:hypothetical protein DFH09DRAFT_1458693 [Mycena vulgaris]
MSPPGTENDHKYENNMMDISKLDEGSGSIGIRRSPRLASILVLKMPPHQASVSSLCLDNLVVCFPPVIKLLTELDNASGSSFLEPISNTALSLISSVQTMKRNKDECIELLEHIHKILCAIITLHVKSETAGILSPTDLSHVAKFAVTLHKIHTFTEAQKDGNRLKHFFRQNEMSILLRDCRTEVQEALEVFQIQGGLSILADITEIRGKTQQMHNELLELISSLSDDATSDRSYSMYVSLNDSQNRYRSLLLFSP